LEGEGPKNFIETSEFIAGSHGKPKNGDNHEAGKGALTGYRPDP